MGFHYSHSCSGALHKKCGNLQRISDFMPPRQRHIARKLLQFTKDRRWDCIIYRAAATQCARSIVIYIGWPMRFYHLHDGNEAQCRATKSVAICNR